MTNAVPLGLVSVGETVEVCHVAGSEQQARRLLELGLRPGIRVEILSQGSPCIVRTADAKLCFRKNEITNIFVRTA